MIRLLRCLKKRSDVTDIEFRRFWQTDEYRRLLAHYIDNSDGIRFHTSLVLHIDENAELQKDRGTREPYDGIVELFWPDAKKATELFKTTAGKQLVHNLLDYEHQFVDFSESCISITDAN